MSSPRTVQERPRPIAIVGPTGSGKSGLSLQVAHRLGGEVVNADSMQLYRGMDIGTAKLPFAEREGIVHHVLDVWDVTEPASVADYVHRATAAVEEVQCRGRVPVIVGGSMMYIQSLLDEWDFPPTDATVRAKWENELHRIGVEALHNHLATVDPQAAQIIDRKDPRRTVRALEVIELTGRPFAASQPPKDQPPRWNTVIVGLTAPADWLNPRLEQRVDLMFDAGLLDEVRGLQDHGLQRSSTAGQAIGYAQVLDHLAGDLTFEDAREQTIIGTRRYARRQRSWFRRDPRITWIDPTSSDAADEICRLVDGESTRVI